MYDYVSAGSGFNRCFKGLAFDSTDLMPFRKLTSSSFRCVAWAAA